MSSDSGVSVWREESGGGKEETEAEDQKHVPK